MEEQLERVAKAYAAKKLAQDEAREAVLAAVDAGFSYPKIAKAAGVTHPAIIDLVRRARRR